MKYEVTFAMCHSETTVVELEEEDIKDKTEGEIEAFVEEIAWRQIRREYTEYEPDEIIEIAEVEQTSLF